MINIKPFKALRPKKELYSSIVSLPYDVLTDDECREITLKNPLSFLNIIRSEVNFNKDIDPYSDVVYEKAKSNLDMFIKKGYLIQDEKPYLYVYRLKKDNISQIGFISAVSANDYDKGLIKKHEETRIDKVNDRIKHIDTVNAHTGFVFLTYRSKEELNKILDDIQKTDVEVDFTTDDNVTHTLWVIRDDKLINKIVEEFKKISCLYIADGHHRSVAASSIAKKRQGNNKENIKERESNYFLSIIFPHNCLNILSYNRAIKDLNGMSIEEFLKKIENNFIIKKESPNYDNDGFKPDSTKKIGMYLDGQWYLLIPKNNIIEQDPVSSLDVSILQKYIIDPILNIRDLRKDKRIDFIGGIRGTSFLKKIVDSGEYKVSFSIYPTSIEQLMEVADAGELMPPKSTWFEPKPRSGLAIHLLDE